MEKLIFDKREALSWCCGEISKKLYQQIKEVCDLPFLYKHFALMADGHLGYGVPIGGVFAMEGIVYKEFGVNKKGKNTLDEAPQAYKDINEVMPKQSDLITPITELFPLGVVKA